MSTDYEYIRMEDLGPSKSGKTRRWSVRNKHHGSPLGWVVWSGPWRQYVFRPVSYTEFSAGCLTDIAAFLQQATSDHRAAKRQEVTRG